MGGAGTYTLYRYTINKCQTIQVTRYNINVANKILFLCIYIYWPIIARATDDFIIL